MGRFSTLTEFAKVSIPPGCGAQSRASFVRFWRGDPDCQISILRPGIVGCDSLAVGSVSNRSKPLQFYEIGPLDINGLDR